MSLNNIKSLNKLANELRIYPSILERIVNQEFNIIQPHDDLRNEIDLNILKYEKRKKSGTGSRVIYAVQNDSLKNLLKILNTKLANDFISEDYIHGFIKGKGIKTNAKMHLSRNYLLSVDIKDFFESITSRMVHKVLQKYYPENQMINEIVSIVTIDNHLPQGYNTSPTIANMLLVDLDSELNSLCTEDMVYTRYADDLYFSSNNVLPKLDDIVMILNKHGFDVNKEKVKYMKRGRRQFVSGLTVFDDKFPRIPKRKKRQLRLETHKISQHGWRNHAIHLIKKENNFKNVPKLNDLEIQAKIDRVRSRIFGWISYSNSIEPEFANKLKQQLGLIK